MKAGSNIAGKYLLEAPLASGGMGSVWRARHVDLDVEVAVKLISSELGSNEQALTRFKREARAAAQLRSPHVVQILDYGVFEGTPYIAMELLSGHDLDSELERSTRLSLARTKTIATQVGKALRLAHEAGIVHRDLKPANIFLAQQGGEDIVKLLDFGIAKESHVAGKITGGSTLLGSPLYMSPEQVAGDPVDARTDVWSLGVVLYECLVGAPPFESPGVGALFAAIALKPPPLPSTRGVQLDGLDAWVERALEKDRDKRFQTAKELVDALLALKEDTYRFEEADVPQTSVVATTSARDVDAGARTVSATGLQRGRESNTLDLATSTPLRADRSSTSASTRRSWVFPIALAACVAGGLVVFLLMRNPGSSGSEGPVAAGSESSTTAPPPTSHVTIVPARASTDAPTTAGAGSIVPAPSASSPPALSASVSASVSASPQWGVPPRVGTPLGSTPKVPTAPPVDTTFGIPIHGK